MKQFHVVSADYDSGNFADVCCGMLATTLYKVRVERTHSPVRVGGGMSSNNGGSYMQISPRGVWE